MHQMEEKKKIFRHFGDGEYDILAKCRLELKLDNEGNNILHLMAKYLDYDGFKELYIFCISSSDKTIDDFK